MIHMLVGKPRNGKSLRAMMHIVEQLTTTDRDVVTNMVIDLDELQSHLDAAGFSIFVRSRVRMLTDKETRNFWLHRGCGYSLPVPADYEDKKGADLDFSPMFRDPRFIRGGQKAIDENGPLDLRGTCYVIDEVHTIWPARGWQGTPRHVDFYNSQHGKMNDEIWFITQNTKLVDPNFYRLAQDFTYCRNHRLLKFGAFRGDNKFVAKTYESPVSSGNEVTLNVFEYKLDLNVARCYDTSAGVGMPGGGTADRGQRTKGVPLKTVWIGLAAVLAVCMWFFGWGMPYVTKTYLAPAMGGPLPMQKPRAGSKPVSSVIREQSSTSQKQDTGDRERVGPVNADKVTGWAGGLFSASWYEGWRTFDEAAGDSAERRQMLRDFAGWKPRPQVAGGSSGGKASGADARSSGDHLAL